MKKTPLAAAAALTLTLASCSVAPEQTAPTQTSAPDPDRQVTVTLDSHDPQLGAEAVWTKASDASAASILLDDEASDSRARITLEQARFALDACAPDCDPIIVPALKDGAPPPGPVPVVIEAADLQYLVDQATRPADEARGQK